ncbi:RNA polymerase II transcription factor [Bimuria novae-zelandiae CBS 107.79]|uniref:RNA polymerase II transcription factor n=1 Tax=Bimuria novae-zelandiae CBS 107.79 TaxID=1447943 RepID=A0A6A5VLC5_9PLEO|nr:RNA polymerase II transcription factor [Bimuria novae-zelandiae CBS 107.79]
MSEAAAQYKKKDGKIIVSSDGLTVSWKANSDDLRVDVEIAAITNLQQTPATSAKASIKIVVQHPDQTENHTFTFTSAAARDDQQTITGVLRKCIEDAKTRSAAAAAIPAAATPTPTPVLDNVGASGAMTMAHTLVGAPKEKEDPFDDAKLLRDTALQQSLLNSNVALRERFDLALRDKPDTITLAQFSNQFWATRVPLLRSHAVQKSQGAGTYNVLSVVKPVLEQGVQTLNMSKEQIQLIFAQHPLVKRVYNENVPPMSERDFWSRFFHSRLVKKLKGERINDNIDPTDPKLDKYLDFNEAADAAPQLLVPSVPLFLDVEGNEQNHSQRLGNRPDHTMRLGSHEKVPILRTLNQMSEKMMAQVPPSDGADRHGPAGMDEETYKQVQLHDLERTADDNRVVLNIQDQSQFFSAGQGVHTSSSAATYAKRTPIQVLSVMQQQFQHISASQAQTGGINLQLAMGTEEESSSDEEESQANKKSKVGSRSSRRGATSQIVNTIKQRQRLGEEFLSSTPEQSRQLALQMGISGPVYDSLFITHNTTVEFLHYFWAVFYSGDAERANEVAKLMETLGKSLDRIKAVADTAEAERAAQIQATVKSNEEYTQRTGRKRRFDANNIKGGKNVVNHLMQPLTRAIGKAKHEYETALQAQMRQSKTETLNPV